MLFSLDADKEALPAPVNSVASFLDVKYLPLELSGKKCSI
jgi:hypothetical protein